MLSRALFALAIAAPAFATPIPRAANALPQDIIDSWIQPAIYAAAAYCSSQSIQAWSCGDSCGRVSAPTILTTGGDNEANPYYYVANNGSHVVVSISGTNPGSPLSVLNDLDFPLVDLDPGYFPDAGGVQAHGGFYKTFTRLVDNVDQAVTDQVNQGNTNIFVTGHSLGGALGHLMGVHLQKKFPWTTVTVRVFASPRVGNQAWADYVDGTLGDRAQHMINFDDVVPQLPPQEWGFRQSSNEVWISNSAGTSVVACQGQESPDCQDGMGVEGQLASIVQYISVVRHLGPYPGGIWLSSLACKN